MLIAKSNSRKLCHIIKLLTQREMRQLHYITLKKSSENKKTPFLSIKSDLKEKIKMEEKMTN